MVIEKFEDIIGWQKAQDLAVEIYTAFGSIKDYGFKDQITRAPVSISNNIAERFDRNYNAEFTKFLYYSKASSSEVRSMLYLANRLNFLDVKEKNVLIDKTNEISKIITGLIKSLKTTNT